jgi:membrane protein
LNNIRSKNLTLSKLPGGNAFAGLPLISTEEQMKKGLAAQLKESFMTIPRALKLLLRKDPLRMAGATAFFTTFALAPILVIIIQLLRLVVDPVVIREKLFDSLSDIIGPEAVEQVVSILEGLKNMAQNWYVTLIGFIFLVFVATTLFKIIKDSMNQIWNIKINRELKLAKKIRPRVQAILVIMGAGILFGVGIFAEGLQAFIGEYVSVFSPALEIYFHWIVNTVVSLLIVTVWFALVFRYLPDARPEWPIALAGGLFTAVLFTIGKMILGWLLTYSNITTLYGTSASIVLILLFVFYSSLILYLGASFTNEWGKYKRNPIRPLPHAKHYRLVEEEETEE